MSRNLYLVSGGLPMSIPRPGLRGPIVTVETAQGTFIPVYDPATLQGYIQQGSNVQINGTIGTITDDGAGNWFVNGQPLCAFFGACPPASTSAIQKPTLPGTPTAPGSGAGSSGGGTNSSSSTPGWVQQLSMSDTLDTGVPLVTTGGAGTDNTGAMIALALVMLWIATQ